MKKKTLYVCEECGYQANGYLGKCPECNSWHSIKETLIEKDRKTNKTNKVERRPIRRLSEVVPTNSDRTMTSINEFNRVMGGGIVKDSITILAAKPGAGKSTLLMQVANDLASMGHKVLYASGEESESQIKSRADRITEKVSLNVWVMSENSMDNVLWNIEEIEIGRASCRERV